MNTNGKNAKALKVLESIDKTGKGNMIWDMALDKGSIYHKWKGLF